MRCFQTGIKSTGFIEKSNFKFDFFHCYSTLTLGPEHAKKEVIGALWEVRYSSRSSTEEQLSSLSLVLL